MAPSSEDKDGPPSHDPSPLATGSFNSGPVATEPLQAVGTPAELGYDEKHDPEKNGQPEVEKRASYTSAVSSSDDGLDTKSHSTQDHHDSWLDKANPLKRSNKPPVPEQREVSREYGAGFFSLLTFQWMAPLMSVSCDAPRSCATTFHANCEHELIFSTAGWLPKDSRVERYLARQPEPQC